MEIKLKRLIWACKKSLLKLIKILGLWNFFSKLQQLLSSIELFRELKLSTFKVLMSNFISYFTLLDPLSATSEKFDYIQIEL